MRKRATLESTYLPYLAAVAKVRLWNLLRFREIEIGFACKLNQKRLTDELLQPYNYKSLTKFL